MGGHHHGHARAAQLADELNVKTVELIGDESELVERRVKPLLPVIGKKHGSRIPAIMNACRANEVRILADGSVEVADLVLAPDEVVVRSRTPAVALDLGLEHARGAMVRNLPADALAAAYCASYAWASR